MALQHFFTFISKRLNTQSKIAMLKQLWHQLHKRTIFIYSNPLFNDEVRFLEHMLNKTTFDQLT
jgi:hypothetical protein